MYYTDFGDIPTNHYSVIYADPPWSYNDKMSGHSFSLDHEYATTPLTWLKTLPVRNITAKDGACLMWVTNPFLDVGIEVMKAWGFKYVTVAFCWVKSLASGKDAVNLGRWTMGGMELCLLGRKGKVQRTARNVRQIVRAVRGRHSEKPSEVRRRIETLFGETNRIELFARGETPGWDQFGNEPGCECWDNHAIADVTAASCGCSCHRANADPQLAVS